MPSQVINPKPSKGKEMMLNIRYGNGVLYIVVLWEVINDSHGIYHVFQTKGNSYCIPKLKFD